MSRRDKRGRGEGAAIAAGVVFAAQAMVDEVFCCASHTFFRRKKYAKTPPSCAGTAYGFANAPVICDGCF